MKQYKQNGLDIVEFRSIGELVEYTSNQKPNNTFRQLDRQRSLEVSDSMANWCQTESYDEAIQLLQNGWREQSNNLTKRLNAKNRISSVQAKERNTLAVAGYQPIVPLYLNGAPANMLSKRRVAVRQKVVTINKSLSYEARVSAETILEESFKALQIVQKLESQGTRVNVNVCIGTTKASKKYLFKVRIKNANEKLNVSKMSFPMIHPSMLRRVIFRLIEVLPGVPKPFAGTYGSPLSESQTKSATSADGEYYIPTFVRTDIDEIKHVEDIE